MLRLVVVSVVAFCSSLTVATSAERRCAVPVAPDHGSVQLFDEPKTGTLAFYFCDEDATLVGISTSKCLSSGDWTFEPPKCLRSCYVPAVQDGELGRYRWKSRFRPRQEFISLQVGKLVKHNELVTLCCKDGYSPGNRTTGQPNEVTCNDGTWSEPLHCHPTRCHVDDLKFPGLVKGIKTVYRNGENLEIKCDSRYQVINATEREFRCAEGTWKGPLPPCVAASCIEPPPKIDHGQLEVYTTFHSSIFKYTCEDPYMLTKDSEVQCLFGEWKGQPPKCEDSRCYLKNLQNSTYVDILATDSITFSGYKLNVICTKGYSPSERPTCMKGKWNESTGSPCKKNDCIVPILPHGDIHEIKYGDYYWNWQKFRYEREVKYVKIKSGTLLRYNSSIAVICNYGYSFQGTSVRSQNITCTKGKWLPDPACLRVNRKYIPRTTTCKPYTTALSVITEQSKTSTTSTKVSEITVTATYGFTLKDVTPAAENMPTTKKELLADKGYCEYPINDENLIAHADGKKLKFHDKVKKGSVVVFRCKHVGFHHLNGVQNIKCKDNRNWHSSEFPTCSEPKQDCSVENLTVSLPESVYPDMIFITGEFITPGSEVQLMCWDDLIIIGYPKAFCNSHGKWEVPDIQCVAVCRVIKDETSRLIVEPVKDYYRFGEFIVLSCPPGQILTSEVERMMCLGRRWSDTLPDCTGTDGT